MSKDVTQRHKEFLEMAEGKLKEADIRYQNAERGLQTAKEEFIHAKEEYAAWENVVKYEKSEILKLESGTQ